MAGPQQAKPCEAAFLPVDFHGQKLAVEVYERRRDFATKQQLNALLNSREYRLWTSQSVRRSIVWSAIVTSTLGLLLGLLALSQPQLIPGLFRTARPGAVATDRRLHGRTAELDTLAVSLSEQLREREVQLSDQLDKNARLEHSLLAAEHRLQRETSRVPTLGEVLMASAAQPGSSNAPASNGVAWGPLWLLPAGAFVALAVGMTHQLFSRHKITAAARAEAELLRQRIDAAVAAQAAAEAQVAKVQACMTDKGTELAGVAAAKRMAELQVADLQSRILELQRRPLADGSGCEARTDLEAHVLDDEKQAMAEELEALQQTVAERDLDLLSLNRELSELTDRLPREVQDRDRAVAQARQWLDEAQGQLQHTQTALNAKERECRVLGERLEEQRSSTAVLQDALEAAKAREATFEEQQNAARGEMQARVASVMDLMKTTRLSLSQKLMQSQATCAALAEELAARDASLTRSNAGSPRVEALRESGSVSSGSLAGFGHGLKARAASSGGSENAAPRPATPEPGHLMAPTAAAVGSLRQPRSPYWFAKS